MLGQEKEDKTSWDMCGITADAGFLISSPSKRPGEKLLHFRAASSMALDTRTSRHHYEDNASSTMVSAAEQKVPVVDFISHLVPARCPAASPESVNMDQNQSVHSISIEQFEDSDKVIHKTSSNISVSPVLDSSYTIGVDAAEPIKYDPLTCWSPMSPQKHHAATELSRADGGARNRPSGKSVLWELVSRRFAEILS